jgi:hypothetical protein
MKKITLTVIACMSIAKGELQLGKWPFNYTDLTGTKLEIVDIVHEGNPVQERVESDTPQNNLRSAAGLFVEMYGEKLRKMRDTTPNLTPGTKAQILSEIAYKWAEVLTACRNASYYILINLDNQDLPTTDAVKIIEIAQLLKQFRDDSEQYTEAIITYERELAEQRRSAVTAAKIGQIAIKAALNGAQPLAAPHGLSEQWEVFGKGEEEKQEMFNDKFPSYNWEALANGVRSGALERVEKAIQGLTMAEELGAENVGQQGTVDQRSITQEIIYQGWLG